MGVGSHSWASVSSGKSEGRTTDNRQAGAVHPDGAPDDVPIASEIPLPQSIPEDRYLRQIHLLIG